MVNPESLLEAARLQLAAKGRPSSAALRRSVSTAYYAMFHLLAGEAAVAMFANPDERRRYAPLAFRDFEHNGVRGVVDDLVRPLGQRKAALREVVPGELGEELTRVCKAFSEALKARNTADYDASKPVKKAAAQAQLALVGNAIDAWATAKRGDDATRMQMRQVLIALFLYGRTAKR